MRNVENEIIGFSLGKEVSPDSLEEETKKAFKKALNFIEQWAWKMAEEDKDRPSKSFPKEAKQIFKDEKVDKYRQQILEEIIRGYKESFPNWLIRTFETTYFLSRGIVCEPENFYPTYYFCGNGEWYEKDGPGYLSEPPDVKKVERPLVGREYLNILRSVCRMILSGKFVDTTVIAPRYYVFEYRTWQLDWGTEKDIEREEIDVVTPREASSMPEAIKKIPPWRMDRIQLQRVGTKDGWKFLKPAEGNHWDQLSREKFYKTTFVFDE